jgi:hypothetical protein
MAKIKCYIETVDKIANSKRNTNVRIEEVIFQVDE